MFTKKFLAIKLLLLSVMFITTILYAGSKNKSFILSRNIYKHVKFISHTNARTPWLAMNVHYKPVKSLFLKLQKTLDPVMIKNRGEAHVTVITPPEYQNILKPFIRPEELDKIALQENIQNSKFKILCLGKGKIYDSKNNKFISTYFIVINSQQLLKIRKAIYQLYISRGGIPSHFDPEHFTPHITIGYTNRDLFENDGIYKQRNSCYARLLL